MAYKPEYPVLNDSGAGSLEEYTKRQEDRIESAIGDMRDHVVGRYQQNGWYVEEWKSGFVRISKLFYITNKKFSSFNGVYATGVRPEDTDLSYPFNIGRVTHINVQTHSGNTSNFGDVLTYQIENQSSAGIDRLLFVSFSDTTRTLRFSINVEGFKS